MSVISVNVSLPKEVSHEGKTITTSIFKEPVHGRVMVRRLNIDGDDQADRRVHGVGFDMAIYAYPVEHYAFWEKELGRDSFPYGQFGENLTVSGLSEDTVRVGDVFRVGEALLQVTQPRIPCFKLAMRMGEGPDFPARFQQSGRMGFYLRVLEVSVDTKKRELVGCFKNSGVTWEGEPVLVKDHDFRSEAIGIAIPYGLYDVQANRGTVFVGTTYDTPDFAVDCVEKWWRTEGRRRYRRAEHLTILADAGGSNGPNSRAWKYGLQTRVCNRHRISVSVAHYPTGASKWNPAEHRLFSEISKNWAGRPLDSYETILNYLRTTKTTTGLRVRAHLVRRHYKKGVKISDAQMDQLDIANAKLLPRWNYTLRPT